MAQETEEQNLHTDVHRSACVHAHIQAHSRASEGMIGFACVHLYFIHQVYMRTCKHTRAPAYAWWNLQFSRIAIESARWASYLCGGLAVTVKLQKLCLGSDAWPVIPWSVLWSGPWSVVNGGWSG